MLPISKQPFWTLSSGTTSKTQKLLQHIQSQLTSHPWPSWPVGSSSIKRRYGAKLYFFGSGSVMPHHTSTMKPSSSAHGVWWFAHTSGKHFHNYGFNHNVTKGKSHEIVWAIVHSYVNTRRYPLCTDASVSDFSNRFLPTGSIGNDEVLGKRRVCFVPNVL